MEFAMQNTLDFNKICRICLSTQNLRPITEFVHSDQTKFQETDIFFCVSIAFVLNKYAHIKFETVDKLPKQICFRCYQQLSSAYSFLKNCNIMNVALMECLQRFENSLNIPSNACTQHIDNNNLAIIEEPEISNHSNLEDIIIDYGEEKVPVTEICEREPNVTNNNLEIIENVIIKEEPEISNHLNLDDIKIDYGEIYEEKISVIESCEREPNVTNNSHSLEITKQPQKSTQSSLKQFQKPQRANPSNLKEFQFDFETEIPVTKIAEVNPQMVTETFDENYNFSEGTIIGQERNDRIHFGNKIQLFSNGKGRCEIATTMQENYNERVYQPLISHSLSQKSADLYEKQYEMFKSWCENHSVENYTENVFLKYFSEKTKNCKSSTLWSAYSMLKSTIMIKHNINISKFAELLAFIKQQNSGYKPKKSSVFTAEDVYQFLIEAPDQSYLMWKVCLIFSIAGACRMDELKKMSINDVDDKGDILIIRLPDSKTGKIRTFTIANKICEYSNPISIYRKYVSLRPSNTPHRNLFIFYRLGKCTMQPVGIHTFGKIPSLIAAYLKLPDAKMYTGRAFQRTTASLLLKKIKTCV